MTELGILRDIETPNQNLNLCDLSHLKQVIINFPEDIRNLAVLLGDNDFIQLRHIIFLVWLSGRMPCLLPMLINCLAALSAISELFDMFSERTLVRNSTDSRANFFFCDLLLLDRFWDRSK